MTKKKTIIPMPNLLQVWLCYQIVTILLLRFILLMIKYWKINKSDKPWSLNVYCNSSTSEVSVEDKEKKNQHNLLYYMCW